MTDLEFQELLTNYRFKSLTMVHDLTRFIGKLAQDFDFTEKDLNVAKKQILVNCLASDKNELLFNKKIITVIYDMNEAIEIVFSGEMEEAVELFREYDEGEDDWSNDFEKSDSLGPVKDAIVVDSSQFKPVEWDEEFMTLLGMEIPGKDNE